MIKIFGIKNCDTCRKAIKWLETEGFKYQFYDLRLDELKISAINKWIEKIGLETLLNSRSTTWRNLPSKIKENLDKETAVQLMKEFPTLIKRPVFNIGSKFCVGYTLKSKEFLVNEIKKQSFFR